MENHSINVVIGLGSNFGDRKEAVAEAITWLSGVLAATVHSEIYETPPYGHPGQPYMNAVMRGDYEGRISDLEAMCKAYETAHGRDAESRRLCRVPIDIDIVIAGEDVLRPDDFRRSFFQIGYDQCCR